MTNGEFWVDASKLKPSAPQRESFAFLQTTFQEVFPQTLKEWKVGFRRGSNPQREIQWWLNFAKVFKYFTDGRPQSKEELKDIFDLVLLACTNGPENVSLTFTPQVLSKKETQEILDELTRLWGKEE